MSSVPHSKSKHNICPLTFFALKIISKYRHRLFFSLASKSIVFTLLFNIKKFSRTTRCQCDKTYVLRQWRYCKKASVFVSEKTFSCWSNAASKAKACNCTILWGLAPNLTRKQFTNLKRLFMDKHSSFCISNSDEAKKFYRMDHLEHQNWIIWFCQPFLPVGKLINLFLYQAK